ncbi:MAG TPA: hypothetical protein VI911_04220 [Patescibacteria group bacterium]|nr:hypothetical protein [Patescibacteria group bacterium]
MTHAQQSGEEWESMIRYGLDALVGQGAIHAWAKQYPPMRAVKQGRQVVWVQERGERSLCDFVVAAHHLTWLLEAKQIEGRRLPWSAITSDEGGKLTAWQSVDARRRAAILVRYVLDRQKVAVLVPWEAIESRWQRWAAGGADRGEGGLTLDSALDLGWTTWAAAL